MPVRGTKRKRRDCDKITLDGHLASEMGNPYAFRNSLLDLSIKKYKMARNSGDLSLRHLVLISNTVKVIKKEVACVNPFYSPTYQEDVSNVCDPSSLNAANAVVHQDLEDVNQQTEEDERVNAAMAAILKDLEKVFEESGSANVESSDNAASGHTSIVQPPSDPGATLGEPVFDSNPESSSEVDYLSELVTAASCAEARDLLENSPTEQVPSVVSSSSKVPEVPAVGDATGTEIVNPQASTSQSSPTVPPDELQTLEAIFGSFDIMDPGYLNDLSFDDPFSDIDTSVFEREALISSSTSSSSPSQATPSNRQPSSEEPWCPQPCNSTSYGSNQGLRELYDLENIMEILVGS